MHKHTKSNERRYCDVDYSALPTPLIWSLTPGALVLVPTERRVRVEALPGFEAMQASEVGRVA